MLVRKITYLNEDWVSVNDLRKVMNNDKLYKISSISKLLRISMKLLTKYIDTGKLKGYRVAGTQDRRVLKSDLEIFLKENKLPSLRELIGI